MPKKIDITGQKFGRLSVLQGDEGCKWRCLCDCGKVKAVDGRKLRSGSTVSCGCLKSEIGLKRAMQSCGVCGTPRESCAECKPCRAKGKAAYKARQRAAGVKRTRPSRALPLEFLKRGTEASKIQAKENSRRLKQEYKQRNPHKAIADTAHRFASKMRATPKWADRRLIDDLYRLAKIYTQSGYKAHVDHAVPLRSKVVCGLHVETNLTVLPATANMLKGNRWWPDMPT